MPMLKRRIKVKDLRKDDRFSFDPPAWYGPSVVRTSGWSKPHWRLTFDNAKIINPPGVSYDDPERKVFLLRPAKRVRS